MYTSMFRKAMLGDTATLNLDFTTGTLDSRLTFTRAAGTATYINSSGYVTSATANTPRFDYDPVTLAPRGLLIEGSAINVCPRSQELTTGWLNANMITPTNPAIADPFGGTSATWKLLAASGSALHSWRHAVITLTAAAYTFSFWAKAAEYDRVVFSDPGSGLGACTFVLTGNGTATVVGGATNPQITPYPNGWYRCSVTMTTSATTYAFGIAGYPSGATLSNYGATYTGTGTDGAYATCLQIELGSGASSYIPTVASQVTRNADECTATGSNFSSWWPLSQSAFTVYWDGDISRSPANTQFYWLTRAGGSSRSRGYVTTGSLIRANNTAYDFTMSPTTSMTVGTRFKSAVAISSGSSAMYANNSTFTGSDTSAGAVTLFDADSLNFNPNAENFMHIRAFKFYQSRLTNAQLLALVS